jgi:hypothetical protein
LQRIWIAFFCALAGILALWFSSKSEERGGRRVPPTTVARTASPSGAPARPVPGGSSAAERERGAEAPTGASDERSRDAGVGRGVSRTAPTGAAVPDPDDAEGWPGDFDVTL